MSNAESIGTDWRSEMIKRVEIAATLEGWLERLLKLMKVDGPLDEETESQVDEVRLHLNKISRQLKDDPRLLNDTGGKTTVAGWSPPVSRHQYFQGGAAMFCRHFQEMESGIYHWGMSNWGHNRKYAKKFQSAGNSLRTHIVLARVMLTNRDYQTCEEEVRFESLEQKRASREEQARMIQAVVDKLRADSEAAKRADIEEVINSICGPPVDHVTLRQCSALVNKDKRTLERWKTEDTEFPTPDVIGGDGTADEWSWANIRPYLEKKANRKLPKIFPSHAGR